MKQERTALTGDLQEVPGIGPKTLDGLRHAGVRTVGNLMRSKPDQLASRLKKAGLSVTAATVERWQAAAADQNRVAQPSGQTEHRSAQPPEDLVEGWTVGPVFMVWFLAPPDGQTGSSRTRTLVYSEKGPGHTRRFDGTEDWVAWVRNEAELGDAGADNDGSPPTTTPSTSIALSDAVVARLTGIPPAIAVAVTFRADPAVHAGQLAVGVSLVDSKSGGVAATALEPASRDTDGGGHAFCVLPFPGAGTYGSAITIRSGEVLLMETAGPPITVTA